jgi:hypothetical protein
MNIFDLIFHDYQSRQSEKSENDLFMCLRCPVFTIYIRKTARTVGGVFVIESCAIARAVRTH